MILQTNIVRSNSLPQEEIQQDQMVEFSLEQEQLFQRRFEEKYDLLSSG